MGEDTETKNSQIETLYDLGDHKSSTNLTEEVW